MRRSRFIAPLVGLAAVVTATLSLSAPASAASGDNYVALGDSYSSGVGTGSESGDCLRSDAAYPGLWASANAPASYTSVACSGATTTDVNNSQLSALSSSTTLVSITIGGNDVGFSDIMTTCALQGEDACIGAVSQAESSAQANLPGWLDTTYNGISSNAPNARVVVLDYPVFYQLGTICVGLSDASHAKIDEGIDMIDGIIASAASRHGFRFGDVRSAFVGHQLCSGDKWLHALNFGDITESYHPNASGHSGGYYPVFSSAAG
ncbi:MAG: SGNH/GDSL hydrolase family protein [Actinocatenispora sp.]